MVAIRAMIAKLIIISNIVNPELLCMEDIPFLWVLSKFNAIVLFNGLNQNLKIINILLRSPKVYRH